MNLAGFGVDIQRRCAARLTGARPSALNFEDPQIHQGATVLRIFSKRSLVLLHRRSRISGALEF